MTIRRTSFVMAFVAAATSFCFAGERGEGKYSGVAIFDRWGGCTLYSGVYVMYVSEAVKQQLRAQAGTCVEIDATKVEQPHNPGDGLIQKFALLGAAPKVNAWESPEGFKLAVVPAFTDGHIPELVIRATNVGDKARKLNMDSLAPTLLMAKSKLNQWSPSDGPSTAVVTRNNFWVGGKEPRIKGGNNTWEWSLKTPDTLEQIVTLQPKEVFELRLTFKLPAGEYDFLAGYGGGVHAGQCIASNLVAFDVKVDGTATLPKVAGR